MLPFASVSCWAPLSLLCWWATRSERFGGVRRPRDRAACEELLRALLRLVHSQPGGFAITIDMKECWTNPWP